MNTLKSKWTLIWLVVFIVLTAMSIPSVFMSKKKDTDKAHKAHDKKLVDQHKDHDGHDHKDHPKADKHPKDGKHASHVPGSAPTDVVMKYIHKVPGYKGLLSFVAAIVVILFAKKFLKIFIQVKDPEEADHAH